MIPTATHNSSFLGMRSVTKKLFYSTHHAEEPVIRGFKRPELLRSQQAVEAYDLKRSVTTIQNRRRRRSLYHLGAFITKPLTDEQLYSKADRLAAKSAAKGSIPPWDWLVAVKDNISHSSFPTTCASKMLEEYVSPYDAAVIESLDSEYSAIVGKTNMDEFGMGSHSTHSHFGPVKNRITSASHERRSAGGSSGGSAVAFVTEQCKMALGTDTGGSIRLPAAYTGTVGFKPSYGRVSRWGLIPYAHSLDTIGFFARLEDLEERLRKYGAFLEDAGKNEGTDGLDPTLLSKSSIRRLTYLNLEHTDQVTRKKSQKGRSRERVEMLRIGVPLEYNTQELGQNVRLVWTKLLENLQDAGHQIVPISLPSTKHALSAYYIIAAAEAASNLAKYDGIRYGHRSEDRDGADGVLYAKTRGEGFGDEVKRRILLGSYTLSSQAADNYFLQAQKIRRLVQRDFDRVFALPNGLRDAEPMDLSDVGEDVALADKTGPATVDLIIAPTAPSAAPTLEEVGRQSSMASYADDVFTVPASLAGLPAISVPVALLGQSPVGMQIIGQYFDDALVLGMAKHIMRVLLRKPFHQPREVFLSHGQVYQS